MYYVVCFAACRFPCGSAILRMAQQYLDATVNRAAGERWRRRWAFIMRLRQSDAHSALIASALVASGLKLARVTEKESAHELADRLLDEVVGDAHWSLPEILRVNAELQLWRGGPGCREAAEATLMRSLELARQQSALSWELRSAMSLARLRRVATASRTRGRFPRFRLRTFLRRIRDRGFGRSAATARRIFLTHAVRALTGNHERSRDYDGSPCECSRESRR